MKDIDRLSCKENRQLSGFFTGIHGEIDSRCFLNVALFIDKLCFLYDFVKNHIKNNIKIYFSRSKFCLNVAGMSVEWRDFSGALMNVAFNRVTTTFDRALLWGSKFDEARIGHCKMMVSDGFNSTESKAQVWRSVGGDDDGGAGAQCCSSLDPSRREDADDRRKSATITQPLKLWRWHVVSSGMITFSLTGECLYAAVASSVIDFP